MKLPVKKQFFFIYLPLTSPDSLIPGKHSLPAGGDAPGHR